MQELCNQQGFVDNLFLYLWMQDPIIKQVPNIKIPDTVIYRNNRVFQWYFYHQGQIKKKSKNKLTNEHIQDVFEKNKPKCGIVAVWIKKQKISNNKQEKLIYEYLNQDQFTQFLTSPNSNEIREGVLQKFIVPKTLNNSVINVMWSQNLCFFEKIENNCRLNDVSLDIYQRALTFELPNSNATVKQLKGSYLVSTLETIAYNIQQHIANLSYSRFQITRLNLIFKIDGNDNIYLLGCRQIKVNDRKLSEQQQNMDKINEIKTGISQNIDISRMSLQMRVSLRQDLICMSCEKDMDNFRAYDIPLKLVVKSWDFDHDGKKQVLSLDKQYKLQQRNASQSDLPNRMDNQDHFIDIEKAYTIPKVIRNLMPKLKEEKYNQLKHNPGFLDTKVKVCEQCYLDIMSSCNINEHLDKITKKIDMQQNFNGIGKLKPEVLNDRYKRTKKNIQLKALFEEQEQNPEKFRKIENLQHYLSTPRLSNPDLKKYDDVLKKVGLKMNQRSDMYLTQLKYPKLVKNDEYLTDLNQNSQQSQASLSSLKKMNNTTTHLRLATQQQQNQNISTSQNQYDSIMLDNSKDISQQNLDSNKQKQINSNNNSNHINVNVSDSVNQQVNHSSITPQKTKKIIHKRFNSQEDLRIQYIYQPKTTQYKKKQNSLLRGRANLSTTMEGDISQQ